MESDLKLGPDVVTVGVIRFGAGVVLVPGRVVVTSLHDPSCSIHEFSIGERRVTGYNSSFRGQQLSGRRYEGKTAIL